MGWTNLVLLSFVFMVKVHFDLLFKIYKKDYYDALTEKKPQTSNDFIITVLLSLFL